MTSVSFRENKPFDIALQPDTGKIVDSLEEALNP
jgi:hypothetical protein